MSAVTCSNKEDIGEYYPLDYDPYFKISLYSDFKGNILKTRKDAINLAKVYISFVFGSELLNDNDYRYDMSLIDNIWYVKVSAVAKKIERKTAINDEDNDSPYSELITDEEIPVSGGGYYAKTSNEDGILLGIMIGK